MPYIHAVHRRVICALVALAPVHGHADGTSLVGGSPRAIGRAGAAVVGDDGGGALAINPAAIARRATLRIQLGASLVEDDATWQSDTALAPMSSSHAGSNVAPIGAAIGAYGRWIIGASAATSAVTARSLPRPGDVRGDLGALYDYRYTGIAGSYRRDTLSIGAARRIGSTLALGVALGASQVRVTEHRRIWAGFAGRESIGDPVHDVDVALEATDRFVPGAVLGLLYAPDDAQIELGASFAWLATARLDGTVAAVGTEAGARIAHAARPSAALDLRQPITVRAAGRYVGDRVVGELEGDLWIAPDAAAAATWRLDGVDVIDPSEVTTALRRVPSRIAQRSHVAIRTAIDVELVPGFLWATGGYAYANLATPGQRLSPSFADLGGHTVGLGVEISSGGFTVGLGWSRTWAQATRAPSALRLDNPFAAGDGAVLPGGYDGVTDQIGVLVEAELGATR